MIYVCVCVFEKLKSNLMINNQESCNAHIPCVGIFVVMPITQELHNWLQ